jgi:phosphohistidine swiveling domain-containing protein
MIDLPLLSPAAAAVFGGKACGLARLFTAGANVPSGFAVEATTVTTQRWSAGDREEFCRRVASLAANGALAVRSSAVGEDGHQRSYAGMFETVLDVVDAEQALDAATRCIVSARGARVLAYASGDAVPAVGVVVQALVRARTAGVCFTVDPSGKDSAVLVEAVAGRGENLVGGQVQPQRWQAYRSGLGGWEIRLDAGGQDAAVLRNDEIARIAEEARCFAARLGYPLDLEWAVDEAGELWWLQARPVTVATSAPDLEVDRAFAQVDDGPVTVWFNWNVRETMPDPLMPLTWSIWRDAIIPMMASQALGTPRNSPLFLHLQPLDLVHGRIYFNMNGILAWPVVRPLMTGALMRLVDPEGSELCAQLMSAGVLRARRLPGAASRLAFDALRASLRSLRGFAAALRPRRAMATLRAFEVHMANRERDRPLSSLGDLDLLEEIRLVGGDQFGPIKDGLYYEILALAVYHQAVRAFRHHPQASRMLAVGIPENPTTEISIGIDALVDAAQPLASTFRERVPAKELTVRLQASAAGRAWLGELSRFMQRYGHRCPKEFDLGAPRWSEAPAMIIELVRIGLESPLTERVADRLKRLASERCQAINDAVNAAARWRRPLLRSLARLVELYMPLREAPKHSAMFAFQRMRAAALELGTRLADRGHTAAPQDVFFLELAELYELARGAAVDARLLIAERRCRFDRFCSERAPNYLRSDGVPVEIPKPPSDDNGILHGTGVSAGLAAGPVRVLTEPDPRAMADGDVIVMAFADPGWTPLFPRAGAVVMEVGGLMCHAAVVARELGIPAVFGIGRATHVLHNGQSVVVDGNRGTVSLTST